MRWEEIPEKADEWTLKAAAPAWDVRQTAARVLTATDVGYYYHPGLEKVAVYAPGASAGDQARVKAAAERAVGKSLVRPLFLSHQELADPHVGWVKVAYSPTLRRAGELLNFFPGQYPGGIPNHPSPVAAMLTSGLLGAGLGWGAGTLLGKLLPEGYGDRLGRTGLVLGGALGAVPGAVWGLNNRAIGRSFNDPATLNVNAGDEPINYPRFVDGANAVSPQAFAADGGGLRPPEGVRHYLDELSHHAHLPHGGGHGGGHGRIKRSVDEGLRGVELGALYRQAVEKVAYAFGPPSWNDNGGTFGQAPVAQAPTPIDVNIDALGRTLWNQGASPNLAATTMGAMYAAQQLPDARSQPGWVTGNQLGQLAMNAAGDYAKGLMVGAALNAAIGTPWRASTFGAANAALGIVGAVVPKLFGG